MRKNHNRREDIYRERERGRETDRQTETDRHRHTESDSLAQQKQENVPHLTPYYIFYNVYVESTDHWHEAIISPPPPRLPLSLSLPSLPIPLYRNPPAQSIIVKNTTSPWPPPREYCQFCCSQQRVQVKARSWVGVLGFPFLTDIVPSWLWRSG